MTQIWIAISVYVLVAIVKRLNLRRSRYENLHLLNLTRFEQARFYEVTAQIGTGQKPSCAYSCLNRFDKRLVTIKFRSSPNDLECRRVVHRYAAEH